MTSTTKIVGSAISLGIVGAGLAIGGGLTPFINIPSLLFVLGIVFGGLWAGFGPEMMQRALGASLLGTPLEPTHQSRCVEVLRRGYRLSWSAGIVGALVGIIQILTNLSDPSQLGQGLATCLLTVFYGALLAELGFSNLHQWLSQRTAVDAHQAAS